MRLSMRYGGFYKLENLLKTTLNLLSKDTINLLPDAAF